MGDVGTGAMHYGQGTSYHPPNSNANVNANHSMSSASQQLVQFTHKSKAPVHSACYSLFTTTMRCWLFLQTNKCHGSRAARRNILLK